MVPHVPVWHPLGHHAKWCGCLRNTQERDDVGVGDPPPHYHLLAKELTTVISPGIKEDQERQHLLYFSYIMLLVYAESLYRHSFVVVDAFPDIAISARGDRIFGSLDELFGNDVRVR